jgi:hypothetical protein
MVLQPYLINLLFEGKILKQKPSGKKQLKLKNAELFYDWLLAIDASLT